METIKRLAPPLATCIGFVGGLVSIAALFSGSDWFQQNKHLIAAHAVYCTIILFLIYLVLHRPSNGELRLPKVLRVLENETLLTEPCGWLSHQTAVAVFKNDDGVELLVALGEVINVQHDKKVQISCRVPETVAGELPDLSALKENLMIKPGITQ